MIKSKTLNWVGHVARILKCKSTRKRSLGKLRRRREDNVRTNFQTTDMIRVIGFIWFWVWS